MIKKLCALVLIGMLSTSLFACGSSKDDSTVSEETFVTINDVEYSYKDFDDFFNLYASLYQLEKSDENKEYFINNGLKESFVFEMLVVQEAQKQGVSVSEKEADKVLEEDVTAAYGSKENYEKQFLDEDTTWDDMVEFYQIALDYEALLDKRFSESGIDLEAVYQANLDRYYLQETVSARHILVETEDEAVELIKKLDEGADFASLAEEYSIDEGSAIQGGALGYFTADQMVSEFSEAAFALEIGTYTKTPVQSPYGYHIILTEDHTQARQLTFDEATDYILNDVENDLAETLYSDLMNNAEIVYANQDN